MIFSKRILLAALAASTLGLARGAGPAAPAAAPAAKPIPLRIAYPSGINGQLAKVVEKAGLAEKGGFAPTFTYFQYGPPMIEALAAGQVDLLFTSFNAVASYLAKRPGGLAILADVGTAKHAVVVPADSPARTLADLKGKSIGVSVGSDLHVDVVRAIRDLGLDPAKDFKLVNLPPEDLAQAFDQKLTDAVDIRIPPLLVLEKKGGRSVAEWPWQLLVVARSGWLDEHPAAADAVRKVLEDGVRFIAARPAEAAAWWGEHLRLDPEVVRAAADLNPLYRVKPDHALDLRPGPDLKARAGAWAESLVAYGIRKEKVSYVYR